ncbi:hypothetical protein FNW52_03980 [Flavobacterium sp. ZT3R18]|uniref:hypothetical protein n=1 Tax=Flavobacterium sp. ZT3R18 TaxID=2594429 RepID=UPI00117A576E|nr:hypothetical protein [Flavobacterium sp. ZT3R18]TRX38068.1 hypothetical protein FNW52_03980 [Flavobacterium sp. ZT3R18]
MDKKWTNVFEFFKSTLLINLAVCLISMLFGGVDSFFFIFPSFGFMISVLYKELYRKNDYLFYSNNGVSKIQLLGYSYVFTLSLSILGFVLILILKELF